MCLHRAEHGMLDKRHHIIKTATGEASHLGRLTRMGSWDLRTPCMRGQIVRTISSLCVRTAFNGLRESTLAPVRSQRRLPGVGRESGTLFPLQYFFSPSTCHRGARQNIWTLPRPPMRASLATSYCCFLRRESMSCIKARPGRPEPIGQVARAGSRVLVSP